MAAIYLWEIFVNIMENVITASLLNHRLTLRKPKYSKIIFPCFVLFSSMLITFCNLSQYSAAATHIFVFLSRLLFLYLLFHNTIAEKIFTCCLPSFMSIFADLITYTVALFVTTNNPNSFDFLGSNRIASTLCYLLVEFIFLMVFRHILTDISYLPKNLYGFLVFTTTIALFASTSFLNIIIDMDSKLIPMKYRLQLNGISLLILLLFLSMIFLIQVISKTYQENIKFADQLRIKEKDAAKNHLLLQSAANLRKWKHDYKNHLIAIQGLINDNAYEQLKQYVIYQQEILSKTFSTINTGHNIIDALLTDKYAVSQHAKIKFTYSIILPKPFPISDVELTDILGNLLDNAIDACKVLHDPPEGMPYIHVSIMPKRNMLHFLVENSSSGNYLYNSEGHLITTKPQKEIHGNGLIHVSNIAKEHHGFCKVIAKPDYFTVNVYIPLLH